MANFPVSLVIFPLVGGYFIITRLEWFKYKNQRNGNQEILFNSIIAGIPLLVLSLCITSATTYLFPEYTEWARRRLPIQDHYFGTCVLSYVIAILGTRVLNKYINETNALVNAIDRIGNELELLIARSFIEDSLVQFTLKSGKIYIGWSEVLPEPSKCPYIQIIPLLSGYRDEKQEMIITTNYSEIYAEYIRKGLIKSANDMDVNLVIEFSEIVTASRFDFEVFEEFKLRKLKEG